MTGPSPNAAGVVPFARQRQRFVPESHRVRKLQLGAGTNVLDDLVQHRRRARHPEVFYLDTTSRFPFDDGTFDYVMSEHHVEHLTYADGLFTLRECHRVLRPGGRLRVATPDLEVLLGLCPDASGDLQRRYVCCITDTFLPEVDTFPGWTVVGRHGAPPPSGRCR